MSWPDCIESATWFGPNDRATAKGIILHDSFLIASELDPARLSGPSEYSPVDAGAKPPTVTWSWMPSATEDQVRAVRSAISTWHTLNEDGSYSVAQGHEVKAGQAVSVDADSFVRPMSATQAATPPYRDTSAVGDIVRLAALPPSRENDRRAIDALLREDARRTPAFATARRAAVLAAYEDVPEMPADQTAAILRRCAEYEELRGGGRKASLLAADMVYSWRHTSPVLAALTAYERARRMR